MSVDKVQATHLLASLVWMMVGCAASLPEFKDRLAPDEQLISLPTRPGVTVRILLRTPNIVPKGTFLFFLGSEGYLVNREGRLDGVTLVRSLS
jgi:hypothetical protein